MALADSEIPMAESWIIQTWTGRHVFTDKVFGSFEEARAFISEHADAVAASDEEYDGICEDLYAVSGRRALTVVLGLRYEGKNGWCLAAYPERQETDEEFDDYLWERPAHME